MFKSIMSRATNRPDKAAAPSAATGRHRGPLAADDRPARGRGRHRRTASRGRLGSRSTGAVPGSAPHQPAPRPSHDPQPDDAYPDVAAMRAQVRHLDALANSEAESS
jgi:hypothetical protein